MICVLTDWYIQALKRKKHSCQEWKKFLLMKKYYCCRFLYVLHFFTYHSCIIYPSQTDWKKKVNDSVFLKICITNDSLKVVFFSLLFSIINLLKLYSSAMLDPKHNHTNKKLSLGHPLWHSGKEFTCQCRGHGFDPLSGKISHAEEQRTLYATTTEPAL